MEQASDTGIISFTRNKVCKITKLIMNKIKGNIWRHPEKYGAYYAYDQYDVKTRTNFNDLL
jgi:hypothetical protein